MASEIPVYPVLNRTLRDRIRFTVLEDYTFFYTDSLGNVNLLEAEDMATGATVCNLLDNKGEWDPDTCDFHIRRQMLLQNTGCLFGEGGITGKEATLGVALIWASADSRQRGAVRLGEITRNAGDTIIDLSADFQPAQFRGRLDLTTILYLKDFSHVNEDEMHMAGIPGTVLGELDQFSVLFDGTGSIFPIYEVNETRQPLWYVRCDWTDPTSDLFEETVAICINRSHASYKYVDRKSNQFDGQLLIEILIAAVGIIITKLKEDNNYWDETCSGKTDTSKGSVSEAVYYFINTLQWDVSSPEALSISMHKFFDQKDLL